MYEKIVLDNGLRVVLEKIPHMRSVTTGIWVGSGSVNENLDNNGISHFIEHMMFKGTKKRTAKEIAECIDNIGGQINAFTGKECTCYYTKTMDAHIDIALDVLSDLFFNSKFAKKEMGIERKVIFEEIDMYEDSPDELVHDLLSEAAWQDNPLGYPVIGTKKSLKEIDADTIKEHIKLYYTPENCVISVAGNFDNNHLIELIEKYFGSWEQRKDFKLERKPVKFHKNEKIKKKEIEQVHLCVGYEALENGNEDLHTMLLINTIMGGGMSSRLFQRIREQKGLVYSIFSYPLTFKNAGIFMIYAGLNPKNLELVKSLIEEEVSILLQKGIDKEELSNAKEQLKGNYILGHESTSSRMIRNGSSELILNRVYSSEEIIKKIDDINMEKVDEIIQKIFNTENKSIAIVGKIE